VTQSCEFECVEEGCYAVEDYADGINILLVVFRDNDNKDNEYKKHK
jgi:hypothetical protein